MSQQNGNRDVAAIVDDSGRVQAQFGGIGATGDANQFLRDCQAGKVKHLHGAQVVTGDKAIEAIKKGRL